MNDMVFVLWVNNKGTSHRLLFRLVEGIARDLDRSGTLPTSYACSCAHIAHYRQKVPISCPSYLFENWRFSQQRSNLNALFAIVYLLCKHDAKLQPFFDIGTFISFFCRNYIHITAELVVVSVCTHSEQDRAVVLSPCTTFIF